MIKARRCKNKDKSTIKKEVLERIQTLGKRAVEAEAYAAKLDDMYKWEMIQIQNYKDTIDLVNMMNAKLTTKHMAAMRYLQSFQAQPINSPDSRPEDEQEFPESLEADLSWIR